MNIYIQRNNTMRNHNISLPNQSKNLNKEENGITINVTEKKEEQSQQNQTKSLYKQLERLNESIQKVKENEKLSGEEKAEKLEQMHKEILDIQKQIAQVQEHEQETKLKEAQEKKAEEEAKKLTPEKREKKVQEAQQKMLIGIAVASSKVKEAIPAYHRVKEYTTQAKLGVGSKYGGNLSLAEVRALESKTIQFEREMMMSLKEANQMVHSADKVVEAYQRHKKEKEENIKTSSIAYGNEPF